MFLMSSLGGASVVVTVAVSVTGAGEAADTAVVRVATETSLHHHSTVLELIPARRRTYHHSAAHTTMIQARRKRGERGREFSRARDLWGPRPRRRNRSKILKSRVSQMASF